MPDEIETEAPPEETTLINLAGKLSDEQQKNVARELIENYDSDLISRSDWQDKRDRWYKLWSLYREPKSEPFEGCSNVAVPLLVTACNQFHGRAYSSIFAAPGMVKVLPVEGMDVKRAKVVEDYMNWQTLYEMDEYEDNMDKLLLSLPLNGTAFKKTYYGQEKDRVVAEFVSAMDLVLPYGTKDLESARRIAHTLWLHYDEMIERDDKGLYENFGKVQEIAAKKDTTQLAGTKKEVSGLTVHNTEDNPKCVLEIHKKIDLPWDDRRMPYVVTVDYDSGTTLRVAERTLKVGGKEHVLNYFTDYHFMPNPEGFYSFGFGHFLEPLNEMANTVFNQIFDSGRLTNSPFGFYTRRAGFKKRQIKLKPGAMYEVDDASQIFFPSMQRMDQVLFQVLGVIQQYAEQITSNSDYLMGREAKGTKTPTAHGTLAIIEQGLVVFGVLTKRIFRQLRQELRQIFILNSLFLPESKQFRILGSDQTMPWPKIKRTDFDGKADLIPVGDPTFASRSIKREEALQLYQLMMTNPLVGMNPKTGQVANPHAIYELTSDLLDTFGKKNKSVLLPKLPEPQMEPEMENAMFMQGDYHEPQHGENHMKHYSVHTGFKKTDFYIVMPQEYKDLLQKHLQQTQGLFYAELEARRALGGMNQQGPSVQNPAVSNAPSGRPDEGVAQVAPVPAPEEMGGMYE